MLARCNQFSWPLTRRPLSSVQVRPDQLFLARIQTGLTALHDRCIGLLHQGLGRGMPVKVAQQLARACPRKYRPTPAPERQLGAMRGWIGRDGPWHGQWTTVSGEKVVDSDICTFTFDPIDLPELGGRAAVAQLNESEHYLARFRRTLKLRLVSAGKVQPLLAGIYA